MSGRAIGTAAKAENQGQRYGGLNEQNSQKCVIVYNEPYIHIYHFKFKGESSNLPINVIVALNIRRLFLMIVSKLISFN